MPPTSESRGKASAALFAVMVASIARDAFGASVKELGVIATAMPFGEACGVAVNVAFVDDRLVTVNVRVALYEPLRAPSMPKLRPETSTKNCAAFAASASTKPAPVASVAPFIGRVVDTSAAFTSAGVQFGCNSRSNAATPATCGADIDVPLNVPTPPFGSVERMFSPGAARSGLKAS